MSERYILSIDQGTTGSRVYIIDHRGKIVAGAYAEFGQIYPKPGWVEHDAEEIWRVTSRVMLEAIAKAKITWRQVAGIGITNQRETTVIWDRASGKPIHHAIVWQCRRTADICAELLQQGREQVFRERTGLVLDAYFSGTKIKWLLDAVPGARDRAVRGELCFGTIDTWLMWQLSGGKVHATDFSNASRTLIFDIHAKSWDEELMAILGVPRSLLPEVRPSSGVFGMTDPQVTGGVAVPISGAAGDQQAALYGQLCHQSGAVKNTYGTGCFMIMNTGSRAIRSQNGLLTTIACAADGNPCYALEGSVFIAGAVIQWLRDGLGLIKTSAESETVALAVNDTHGVYVVPAFVGLGAPYWDMYAQGAILGLTRGSSRAHIVRAALESIAFQSNDLLGAMQRDSEMPIATLRVDGGACKNDFLMQFQADVMNLAVDRPTVTETTVMGAAFLAGLGVGFWRAAGELAACREQERVFEPTMSAEARDKKVAGWRKAVSRVLQR